MNCRRKLSSVVFSPCLVAGLHTQVGKPVNLWRAQIREKRLLCWSQSWFKSAMNRGIVEVNEGRCSSQHRAEKLYWGRIKGVSRAKLLLLLLLNPDFSKPARLCNLFPGSRHKRIIQTAANEHLPHCTTQTANRGEAPAGKNTLCLTPAGPAHGEIKPCSSQPVYSQYR